ncbi:HAMP domain-containing histidine kinase [Pedobacter sp. BS3]|uniref:sensor histidine kinase n=1 Tax=Pedobacter sp. BS3 TaxID=2567937 RepID=UPI0011EE81C4|nr:HAMP domain-containing sensor histidine kinase [Pedobacter sp. BS3]TZF82264.1 HAMP domain-containing histidine kinase [Pedobacter sp. BS3]
MAAEKSFYRKNFALIVIFLLLVTVSLVIAWLLAYSLIKRNVENDFSSAKIDVQEEVVQPYNDFFQNRIPEISFYQGYLDSSSVAKYIDTAFTRYAFVSKVIFYDTQVSNHKIKDGLRVNKFAIGPKVVMQFKRNTKPVVLFTSTHPHTLSLKLADEFNKIAIKFSAYIESADTTKVLSNDDIFNTFYAITPNRITYMNIPRREEIRIYKDLMLKEMPFSAVYEQDVLTFYIDPLKLRIKNPHPELYQNISIRPLVYEELNNNPEFISTDIPLPGALADYKLYFSSLHSYLNKEINRRFLPVAFMILLIYSFLLGIAYLIYRNLNINSKLFKLQYDFINNLTHEFKTPVSVIKIAGNNIRSSKQLSDKERAHYGKILDEEADKLNDLMNKLLSFTQIENRSIKLKEEEINLEVFTQNIIDAYQIKHPQFDISFDIDEDITYFKSDPVLLSSVFTNLIDNAYKYSPPDRKMLHISIHRIKKNILFKFTDEGIGMEESELKHIFKKFYRIQSQYNQQGSVGLGLAFCKELINFMNGEITVSSKPGKGSEFIISLPDDYSL